MRIHNDVNWYFLGAAYIIMFATALYIAYWILHKCLKQQDDENDDNDTQPTFAERFINNNGPHFDMEFSYFAIQKKKIMKMYSEDYWKNFLLDFSHTLIETKNDISIE